MSDTIIDEDAVRAIVKPLEWKPFFTNDGREVATTSFGISYHVSEEGWWFPLWELNKTDGIDDAKAGAQADYVANILSSLSIPAGATSSVAEVQP